LYPQGGTWLYDRGNWCPGAFVYPRLHDEIITPGSTHTIDIDMEVYTDAAPSGNEFIRSYLIEYKQPTNQNDVRIDGIFRPSNFKEYTRINPVCDNPIIHVSNVGSNNITSMPTGCPTRRIHPPALGSPPAGAPKQTYRVRSIHSGDDAAG
jgi:hypothetical protein